VLMLLSLSLMWMVLLMLNLWSLMLKLWCWSCDAEAVMLKLWWCCCEADADVDVDADTDVDADAWCCAAANSADSGSEEADTRKAEENEKHTTRSTQREAHKEDEGLWNAWKTDAMALWLIVTPMLLVLVMLSLRKWDAEGEEEARRGEGEGIH
jgi:hypothetical protein